MNSYQKMRLLLRERLSGLKAFNAVKALNYAETIHTGTRKDNITPEFQHQLEIAAYLFTLQETIIDIETVMICTFLHDSIEDIEIITHKSISDMFGVSCANKILLLAKKGNGFYKDINYYYNELSLDRDASLVKGADRLNNISSMLGVFDNIKIISYIDETRNHVLPMLKQSRKLFPEQKNAYENIKYSINSHINPIEFFIR